MASRVAKGIALALPFIILFALLFSSADLAFKAYAGNLVNINLQPETVTRIALVILATLALLGGYSYTFGERREPKPSGPGQYTPGKIEGGILFGSLNVLFLLFIIVQLRYLFGGQSNISELGFTYAEYARRGFFELIAVAFVSLLLLFFTHTLVSKFLSLALTAQVLVIMASSFKRLLLYEDAYGFTTLRLYSHAFIVLLAVIFVLLAWKIIAGFPESRFAFSAFLGVVAFVAAMNLINPDSFIARRNIERFAGSGKLDADYLLSLSEDAWPETVKVLNHGALRAKYEKKANSPLFWKWQAFNLSRSKNYSLVHQ